MFLPPISAQVSTVFGKKFKKYLASFPHAQQLQNKWWNPARPASCCKQTGRILCICIWEPQLHRMILMIQEDNGSKAHHLTLMKITLTMKELKHCLSLTTESSPGGDEISYSMIKHVHSTMLQIIIEIYNRIFTEDVFPEKWKTTIVIPIQKTDKDSMNPLNYRPISLISCICKLLEKIVNFRLMWYLESNEYIAKAQSGFRKDRSTTDHLTRI